MNDIEYNRILGDFVDPRKRLVLHLVFERAWNDSRIDKLTQSLHKFGFQNIVIAIWVSGIKHLEIARNALIFRVKLPFFEKRGLMMFLSAYAVYCLRCITLIAELKAQVVHCHNLETSIPVLLLKLIKPNLKYIYDSHELHTETNMAKKRSRLLRGMSAVIEKKFATGASSVIQTTQGRASLFKKKYGVRAEIISNYPSVSYLKNVSVSKKNTVRDEFCISPQTKILLYVGSVLEERGLETICSIIREDSKLVFVVLGKAVAWGKVLVKEMAHFSNFYYHPPIESSQVISFIRGADCGVCLIEDSCLSYHYSKPTKLFEYIYAGIPVLGSPLPEIKSVINNDGYPLGEIAEPRNIQEVRNAIYSIFSKSYPADFFERVRSKYSWENQEDKIRGIYRKAFGE